MHAIGYLDVTASQLVLLEISRIRGDSALKLRRVEQRWKWVAQPMGSPPSMLDDRKLWD